jgi:hypothetical protein
MDLGRTFGGMFKDPRWGGKVLIGALVGLVPLANFATLGYGLEYVRNVRSGRDELPEWGNFGQYWVQGFLGWLGLLLYFAPAFVIIGLSVVPVLSAAASSSLYERSAQPIAAALTGSLLFLLLALLYTIAVSVLSHAGLVNYAMDGNFGAMFRAKDIWARITSGSGYFAAWLVSYLVIAMTVFVAGLLGGALGMIPCIGQVLAIPLGMFIGFLGAMMIWNGFGQYAQRAYAPTVSQGFAPYPGGGYVPAAMPGSIPPAAPAAFIPPVASVPSAMPGGIRPSMPPIPGRPVASAAAAVLDEPLSDTSLGTVVERAAVAPVPLSTIVAAPPVPEPPIPPADDDTAPTAEFNTASISSPISDGERDQAVDAAVEPSAERVAAPVQEAPPQAEPVEEGSLERADAPVVDEATPTPEAPTPHPLASPPVPPAAPIVAVPEPTPVPPATPVVTGPRTGTIIDRPGVGVGGRMYMVKGSEVGRSWRLPQSDMKLGRDEKSGIVVTDGKASREHAKVQYRQGRFRILDMGSSNGTFVNDERIAGPTFLQDHDKIRIGDTVYEFRYE